MARFIFICVFVITGFCTLLEAQPFNLENVCSPSFNYFDKTVYKAASQNWTIQQNKQGLMYFANSSGLLEFDGFQWKLYPTPTLLRCIAIDKSGAIYGGMQNDFGCWKENPFTRKLEYSSLTKKLKLSLNDDEIWKIIITENNVYFNSFHTIFNFNKSNNTISIINAPNRLQFVFKVNNRIFVQEKVLGLMELINDKLTGILGGNVLNGDCVYGMSEISKSRILISTIDKGLYKLENNIISVCEFSCNDFLKKNQIFSMTKLFNGYLAFGTILNGLLITDSVGNIVTSLNKSKGLPNNTVLSILEDRSGNLWLGLDKGICHLQINNPVYTFPDTKGNLGSVYQIIEYNNKIYFATNQGLFYSPINEFKTSLHEPNLFLVPQTQGQVWKLQIINNRLFCAHNKGLFVINGNEGKFIFKASGINSILEVNDRVAVLLTYSGMYILKMNGTNYEIKPQTVCPYNASYLAKDKYNNIYFGNPKIGIMKAKFDKDFEKVEHFSDQLKTEGVNNRTARGIYSYGENLYLLDSIGIKIFDYKINKFVFDKMINNLIPANTDIHNIQLTADEMWCFASNQFFCIRNYDKGNAYFVQNNKMKSINDKLVFSFESITKINQDSYIICTSSGFDILNSKRSHINKNNNNINVLIRDVGLYSTIMKSMPLKNPISFYQNHSIEFPFNHEMIYFSFTLPIYESIGEIHFSYRMKGFSNEYSIPSSSNIATFTKLPSGNYTFQVRATIDGSNKIYYSKNIQIKILPP